MEKQYDEIIETANALFKQYGIRSVTIDNVSRSIRISKKTFYNYFRQKEDLVDAVLTVNEKNIIDKLHKLLKDNNAIDSLILIIKEMKKVVDSKSPTMYYDLKKYYPNLLEKHEKIQSDSISNWFESNLKQGIEEGFYRDDIDIELVSLFHVIQANNTFLRIQELKPKYSKKRLIEFYIDFIIHLIANDKGLKYFQEHYNRND